jgi:signal transduction histidine kinase/CHASE3 domain sensor protein
MTSEPDKPTRLRPPLGGGVLPAFLLGVVTLIGIGIVAVRSIGSLVETSDWVAHTHEVLATLAAAEADVTSAEASRRGYALSGAERHLDGYEIARSNIAARLDHLGVLVADNPSQQRRLGRLRTAVQVRLTTLDQAIAARRDQPDMARQAALTDRGELLMKEVRAAIDDLAREEAVLLAVRERSARASARRASLVVVLGSLLALGTLGGSAVMVRRQAVARLRAEEAVRASEATYRTTARHFPNGALLVFDRDLRYLIADGTALRHAPETLVGKTMEEAMPAEVRPQIEPYYRAALEGRPGTLEVLYGGRCHRVEFVPVPDEEGHVMAGLAMSQDITEQRESQKNVQRLNQELARNVTELTAVNGELEAFSYSVSHDLRAPLRHINGFVDLLQRRAGPGLDETARRHLATIAGAARQMGQLIDDLLSFSRMGRAELMRSRVRLAALVEEVREGLGHDTQGREVAWKVDGLPEVVGDPAMLRVVLNNLLSNALKYSRTRGRAEIEVGWRRADDGQALVWVRDNGVGFDMQYAGKLFGVFQRLHRAAEFEGTGIGLATVRRIVHRHGGRTWAEGAVDAGATVYFSLPLYEEGAA